MRSTAAVALVAAVIAVTGQAARAQRPGACPPGEWIHSDAAAWLLRAVETTGYAVDGCTGSAWTVAAPRTRFSVWTSVWARPAFRRYARSALRGAFTDGTRIVWEAQGLAIWVQAGPSATDRPPGPATLARLQLVTRRLPRVLRPIELMPTPPVPLARCRSDRLLRTACRPGSRASPAGSPTRGGSTASSAFSAEARFRGARS